VWSRGKVVAAVSVGGPSSRLPARELPRLGRLAIEAAQAIGRRLGQDETVDPFQVPVR
jgi:DNA-binding IclR family transcriptional regulator